MADWHRIKAEYITEGTSYRKLAEKYNVNVTTIAKRAKLEDWVTLRKQQANETQTKIIEKIEGKKVGRAERLQSVTDKLLDKVELLLDDTERVGSSSLRNLSATLRDIKEIQMIRSELDDEEQRVRIANLRKQAEKDDKDTSITVTLEGELSEYAE